MSWKKLAYFLTLLLLSASTDEIWAATTVQPSDVAVAADNDEYLPAVRQPQLRRERLGDVPVPCGTAVRLPSVHAPRPPSGGLAETKPLARRGSELLYVLMSLQR